MNTGEKKEGMTGRNLVIAILIVGAFVTILNQTLLVTAVPVIMADLNIPFSTAQWLTTGFFLVNGIMIPVSAFLINKFTTRKLYMTAMILFTIGTIIAAVSVFPMRGRTNTAGRWCGDHDAAVASYLLQMFQSKAEEKRWDCSG